MLHVIIILIPSVSTYLWLDKYVSAVANELYINTISWSQGWKLSSVYQEMKTPSQLNTFTKYIPFIFADSLLLSVFDTVFDCAVCTLTDTVLLYLPDWCLVAPGCKWLLLFKCPKYMLNSCPIIWFKSQGNCLPPAGGKVEVLGGGWRNDFTLSELIAPVFYDSAFLWYELIRHDALSELLFEEFCDQTVQLFSLTLVYLLFILSQDLDDGCLSQQCSI